jgi:hypothetical protein
VIPLIFSFQQLIEGFLWLALENPDYSNLEKPATLLFLIIAQIFWPFWVPFSILLTEVNPLRRTILAALSGIGLLVAVYLGYCLFTYPAQASISGHHISYELDFPYRFIWFSGLFYFIPTVIPAFISGLKKMFLLGFTILSSFIVTRLFFNEHLISVWCYFAAVISVIVYFIMRDLNKKKY